MYTILSRETVPAKPTTGGPSAVILHALSLVVIPAEGISSLINSDLFQIQIVDHVPGWHSFFDSIF
jgi:hypothetical protein